MKTHTIRQRLLQSTMIGSASLMALVAVPAAAVLLAPTQAAAQNLVQGAVSGTVETQSGAPVAGATVTLQSVAQGFTRTYTTGADGSFRAVALPQGQYVATVTSAGNDPLTDTISVGAGGTTSLTFTVGRAGGAAVPGDATQVDDIVVVGVRQAVSEFDATTTGLTVNVEELSRNVPIARDAGAVALLAPGVTASDGAFGAIPTIGGASAGENTYFINGLNITKFRDFTGSSTVPFEFYQTLETKTGGYSSEFGRGTGGVLNGTTKSGGNEWEFGVTAYWEPDSLRSQAADTYLAQNRFDEAETSDVIVDFGGPIIRDRLFVFGLYNFRDREFFNVGAPVARNDDFGPGANATLVTSDDPFYGAKVDFLVTDDHRLEFTYFSDEQEQETRNLYVSNADGSTLGEYTPSTFKFGGENWIARYTGIWTDWLTTSIAYGINEYNESAFSPGDAGALITDQLPGYPRRGIWGVGQPFVNEDEREVLRADVDLYVDFFGAHHFRLGIDNEKLTASQELDYSGTGYNYCRPLARNNPAFRPISTAVNCTGDRTGGLWFRYQNVATSGASLTNADGTGLLDPIFLTNGPGRVAGNPNPNYNPTAIGASLVGAPTQVRIRAYDNDGGWTSEQNAYYIQDSWEVTDRLTLNLGVRNEGFENANINGVTFIDLQDQWAPRLGFTYDVTGDRTSKLFGFYGRYFLPVAVNTNQRLAGAELFTEDLWQLDFSGTVPGRPDANRDGIDDSTDEPILRGYGTTNSGFRSGSNFGGGDVKSTASTVDAEIDPMYVDEFILGYEQEIFGDWTFGLKGTYRELGTAIDDVAIDAAVLDYCSNPNPDNLTYAECYSVWYGFHQYVLTNPGEDMRVTLSGADLSRATGGRVTADREIVLSAEDLRYPAPERTYKAVEVSMEKSFDGVWGARFSYVWSENEGNYEGALKSDNGQTDPGLSQDFDQPGLTNNSYGFLPNHRAHAFKAFGNWQVTPAFNVGANLLIQSPRKFGCQGIHPENDPTTNGDFFASFYGAASWFCDLDGNGTSEATPRGSQFESDWLTNVDMTFAYDLGQVFSIPGESLVLRADVFNIFDADAELDFNEFGELDNGARPGPGAVDPNYRKVTAFQAPRSVRFSLAYRF